MKYRRTRKSVLDALILLMTDNPASRLGSVFKKWCLKQIERDYPLFHWALKNKRHP